MIKLFTPFMSFILLAASTVIFATATAVAQSSDVNNANQCPAINCDCESIEGEKWRNACRSHESRIKKACVANANTPKDYCSIHGLAAKPLPLSIEFSEFSLSSSTDVKDINDKIESLQWLVSSDTGAAKETLAAKNYSRTLQILKLVESNLASMFEQQQKLEAAYVAKDDEDRVAGMWRKAANETKKYAKELEAFGAEMANAIDSASTDKDKKIFTVLSKKTIRLAGMGFEHAGYAYGRANRHDDAAETWGLAASVSEKLLGIDKALGSEKSAMKFNELQAAARMHRMSYHYMLDNEVENAIVSLRSSQTFVNRQEQQFIGDLVDALESFEEDDGVLTGR